MLSRSMRMSAMVPLPRDGGVPISLWPKGKLRAASGARAADAAEDSVREAEADRLGLAPPRARRERRAIGERAVRGALVGNAEPALDVTPGRPTEDELAEVRRPDRTHTHARIAALPA